MKELKPYLRRSLHFLSIEFFLWTNAGNTDKYKPATISNFQRRIVQNEKKRRTVFERDEEDWL